MIISFTLTGLGATVTFYAEPMAPMAVNPSGAYVTSGSSPALALAVGANNVTCRVVSEDLSDVRLYTFAIERLAFSSTVELKGLSIATNGGDAAVLIPAFSSVLSTYLLRVGYDTNIVTLLPTPDDISTTTSVASVEAGFSRIWPCPATTYIHQVTKNKCVPCIGAVHVRCGSCRKVS